VEFHLAEQTQGDRRRHRLDQAGVHREDARAQELARAETRREEEEECPHAGGHTDHREQQAAQIAPQTEDDQPKERARPHAASSSTPSRRTRWRSAASRTARSWLATTAVIPPSRQSSHKIAMTPRAFSSSRAPVGSSARTSRGEKSSAR